MKMSELYDLIAYGERDSIQVRSAYNGKILCKRFNPEKHPSIAEREVRSLWPSIKIHPFGLSNSALPILECFVDGSPEYEKEHSTEPSKEGNR